MKQKYTILRDEKTGALTIQEYAELSKDIFSLICEESYTADTITAAMGENKKALIDTLRTPNLYPVSDYIDKIADSVIELFDSSAQPESGSAELIFDDVDLFKRDEPTEEEEEDEDESVEIEDLLEEDSEEEEDEDEDEEEDEIE